MNKGITLKIKVDVLDGEINIHVDKSGSINYISDDNKTNIIRKEVEPIYVPQYGDIIHLGEAYPFIGERLGIFNTCARGYYGTIFNVFLNINKVEYNNWSAKERPIRLATEEECEVVFKKLKELDKKWNPDTKKIEDIYIPKDGDVIYVKLKDGFEYISVFKTIDDSMLLTYCDKSLFTGIVWTLDACFLSSIDQIKEMRIATEEQKKILFDGLASKGKHWNEQDKVLEDIPKVGDLCIFWDNNKSFAAIHVLEAINGPNPFYITNNDNYYKHCIKFKSEEQFKKLINEKV